MASRQPGIREAIQVLSGILATNCGVAKIPSESFRLAKFNRPEVAKTFRHLLIQLTRLNAALSSSDGCDGTGSDPEMRGSLLAARKHLFSLGYCRLTFYTSHDGGGSRELLLAAIWMLHKSSLLQKLIYHHLKMANRRVVPLGQQVLMGTEEEEAGKISRELEDLTRESASWTSTERLQDNLHKLVWLKGKLRAQWRMALSAQHAYQTMAHSLHKYTFHDQSSSAHHLTVHELYLLQHPKLLEAHLKALETHISALQSLSEWARHEEVFWKWGESILDLQDKEEAQDSSHGFQDKEAGQLEPVRELATTEELSHNVQRLKEEVRALQEKNAPHTDRILRVWATKSSSLSAQELKGEEEKLKKSLFHWCGLTPPTAGCCGSVEELSPSDCAAYLPAREEKEQRGENTVCLKVSEERTHTTLRHTERAVEHLQSELLLQLVELERQHLPANTYSIAPQLNHLSKMHK